MLQQCTINFSYVSSEEGYNFIFNPFMNLL